MRTFANFIYLGNTLNAVPLDSPAVKGVYDRIFRPILKIVEDDCGTRLGSRVAVNDNIIGKVELDNSDQPIVPARFYLLLQQRQNFARIRTLKSCTSVGGICRKCLWSSYQYLDPNWEQTRLTITTTGEYPSISSLPAVGSSVRFDFTTNTQPFLSHLSETYSGSMIGIKSYSAETLPLREQLFQDSLTDASVSAFFRLVQDSGVVNSLDLEYAKTLNDNLEKCLFLLVQYAIGYYVNA